MVSSGLTNSSMKYTLTWPNCLMYYKGVRTLAINKMVNLIKLVSSILVYLSIICSSLFSINSHQFCIQLCLLNTHFYLLNILSQLAIQNHICLVGYLSSNICDIVVVIVIMQEFGIVFYYVPQNSHISSRIDLQ